MSDSINSFLHRQEFVKKIAAGAVRSLVEGNHLVPELRDGWLHFEVASISDHDVFVIGWIA